MASLNTIVNNLLNAIFPLYCVSCGTSGTDVCEKCILNFPQAERESAEWIFPLYDYRHPPLKKALWLLKYKGKKRIAIIFAEMLHGKILEELSDLALMENFKNAILIPIPLAPKRYRERGYNQAELMCIALEKIDKSSNFKLENKILTKPKDTEHQAHIKDRRVRLKNLAGSFRVEYAEHIQGRNIILIDDITTTGATLNEARKTLKKSGAKKIIAFTVAH